MVSWRGEWGCPGLPSVEPSTHPRTAPPGTPLARSQAGAQPMGWSWCHGARAGQTTASEWGAAECSPRPEEAQEPGALFLFFKKV